MTIISYTGVYRTEETLIFFYVLPDKMNKIHPCILMEPDHALPGTLEVSLSSCVCSSSKLLSGQDDIISHCEQALYSAMYIYSAYLSYCPLLYRDLP